MEDGVVLEGRDDQKKPPEEILRRALMMRRTDIEENGMIKGQMPEWNAARLLPKTARTSAFTFVIC